MCRRHRLRVRVGETYRLVYHCAVKPVLRRKLHHCIMQDRLESSAGCLQVFQPTPPTGQTRPWPSEILADAVEKRMPHLPSAKRHTPKQTNVILRQGGLSDLFVQSAAFMVLDKLRQGCLMQFRQHIAELGRFGFPGCERGPVDSAQGADEGVPVLSAYFPVLVPMSVIDAHGKSLSGGWSRKGKDDD
jgi:hypothetical protein